MSRAEYEKMLMKCVNGITGNKNDLTEEDICEISEVIAWDIRLIKGHITQEEYDSKMIDIFY